MSYPLGLQVAFLWALSRCRHRITVSERAEDTRGFTGRRRAPSRGIGRRRLSMRREPGGGGTSSKSSRKILLGSAVALALTVVAGGVVWTVSCPCETTPGFVLLGDTHEEPVADWSFANDVSLCQIQIGILLRPHSLTTRDASGSTASSTRSLSIGRWTRPRSIGSGPPGSGSCRNRRCRRASPAAAASRRRSTLRDRKAGGRATSCRARSGARRGAVHRLSTAALSGSGRFSAGRRLPPCSRLTPGHVSCWKDCGSGRLPERRGGGG